MKISFEIDNIISMTNFAERLAKVVLPGDIILLKGDLGAGKTFLSKKLISCLVDEECEVISPTFMIVQHYESKLITIRHYDLYRIEHSSELEEIGIFDNIDKVLTIIEWPEIVEAELLQDSTISININAISGIEEGRSLSIEFGGNWQNRINDIC